jgi:gliding motility-associated-like protein
MLKITKLFTALLQKAMLLCILIAATAHSQVYRHDFGQEEVQHPYTVAPSVLDAGLSGSVWTNTNGQFIDIGGSSGSALSMSSPTGSTTPITSMQLILAVAPGKQLEINSFSFWTKRTPSAAPTWNMSINGSAAGTGAVTTTGASTGLMTLNTPLTGLTGTVTIMLNFVNNPNGAGTVTVDDFTLYGSVTDAAPCTAPTVTSLYPASGPSNTVVNIEGSGFMAGTGTSSVKFNGVDAAGFTVVSDQLIKAIVPASATSGAINIMTNGCQGNSATFTVLATNCPDAPAATEMYISEIYDQKTGNGGMIEIYNPTSVPITFDGNYRLQITDNTGDETPVIVYNLTLTGTIAPGSFHLVAASSPDAAICPTPPQQDSFGVTESFNQSDVITLFKNNTAIDIVNVPAQAGFSMIRKPAAVAPAVAFSADSWDITLHDNSTGNTYCSTLGTHSTNNTTTSVITAQPFSQSVCEDEDAQFTVTINNGAGFSFQWKVLTAAGNWVNVTNGEHYSGANSTTLTIIDTPLEFLANQYYCVATAGSCTLISNAVQLTVSPLPIVIASTTDATCLFPTGSVTFIPSIGEGLTYSKDGLTYQTSPTFTGLFPDEYMFFIRSASGCISTMPVTIDPALEIPDLATVVVVQPGCGSPTGSIEITGPLGLGLSFSINGTDFGSASLFTGLEPGTYTVRVQTLLGCLSPSLEVVLLPVPATPAVATATAVQPTCAIPTGSITVTAPLGGEYTYSINGVDYQGGTTFTGLQPDNYTIYVKNGNSCPSAMATPITINPVTATPAIAEATAAQPTCAVQTGSITITAPLGNNYTYSIDNVNYQSEPLFTGLAPGSYTVYTVINGSCPSITTTSLIIGPVTTTPAVALGTATAQPTCDIATGTITVTEPLGNIYTYSLNNVTFQESPVFTGLAPGSYTIYTSDGSTCASASTAAVVIEPVTATPAIATATAIHPTCNTATGSIVIAAPTGPNYSYSIDNVNYQTSTTFTGLNPGDYTVYVVDNGSCPSSTTTPVTINNAPAAPGPLAVSVTPPTCTAGGIIEVTPVTVPGAGFMYSVNGGTQQAGTTFANLQPGTYTVTAHNNTPGGCNTSSSLITIINPVTPPAAVAIATQQPTCTTATGTIVVSTPAGTNYTYSIDNVNYQESTTFSGLEPGGYTVYVKDNNSCPSSTATPIVINVAPAVPAAANAVATVQPDCATPTGTIKVSSPTGGNYTYSIDNVTYQNTATFTGLSAGEYYIYVKENGGCPSVTTTPITINPVAATPVAATTSHLPADCTSGKGSITVLGPLGTDYSYSLNDVIYQSSPLFTDVAPGSYTVYTVYNGSCPSATTNSVIIDPVTPTPQIATIGAITQPTCGTPTGSFEILAPVGNDITYSIDNITYQSDRTFTGLTPGSSYTVYVRDGSSCPSATASPVVINQVSTVVPQITSVQGCTESVFGKAYTIVVTPSNSSFDAATATYEWRTEQGALIGSNEGTLNVTEYLESWASNAEFPMNFTLEITTAGGCSDTFTFTVDETLCGIPKGISPNNDGKNDNFSLIGMNVSKVSIFNRYGKEVFSKSNYRNEWFGQGDNGDELPSGTYYYVIEGRNNSQTGWVYINREEN